MHKSLIAVDIDEVLARHNLALADWHNAVYGTSYTAQDYSTEYWSKVWGTSSDEADIRVAEFHSSGAHGKLKLVAGAKAALKELKKSYDLAVITVRRQCIINDTHSWVNQHFPDTFKEIHFVHFWDLNDNTTKADLCKNIGAQYLIDDSVKHCTQAAQNGIRALLFGDYSWNQQDVLPSGVRRVKDWGDVISELKFELQTSKSKGDLT